jgi:hypothetical protein
VHTLTDSDQATNALAWKPRRGWLIATAIGAIGASVVYVGTTVIGGVIVPGYSHVEDSVSSLTSPGGPFRAELGAGFALYNAAVIVMAIGLLKTSRPALPVRIATALLVVGSIAGVLMVEPFPQDPMGAPLTAPGVAHLVLAGFTALGLVAAAVLYGLAWRRDHVWRRMSAPSIGAAAVILVTGGVGAALVTSPVFGLLERVTQFSFLSWFAAIGVIALSAAHRQGQGRVATL